MSGGKISGQNGVQMDLGLKVREKIKQEAISVYVPLGDREALLRRAGESRFYSKHTVLLQDHLHFSLIKRIREGNYFPRRVLIAASKPTSPVAENSDPNDSSSSEGPKASAKATSILSGREERSANLQLTIRGWSRVLKAAEVVNTDLARLEAQVATSGTLFRWPFERCGPQVLVRAAAREIAAGVRKGEPCLFSQGRGASAQAARPRNETDPQKACSAKSRLARSHPAKSRAARGSVTRDSSEGHAGKPTVGLETALSRHQGFRAGSPTGHSRVPVPLVEEVAERLEDRADGEEWSPAHLVRQGIGWVASLAAKNPGRALAKAKEARRLQKEDPKKGNAKGTNDSRFGGSGRKKPDNGETDLSRDQEKTAREELSCTLELCPTRRIALKEATRSLSDSVSRSDEKELSSFGLEDVTRAAALWAAGLLEDQCAGDPTASGFQKASRPQETVSEKENDSEEAYMEEILRGQTLGNLAVASQEGGMPGPQLFEKPEGQDRSGWPVGIAITPEAKTQLDRKARRYFRKPSEMARLAIGRMVRWTRESPAEAFGYIQEESDLYQPPQKSKEYQYVLQLYIGFEMKVSVWQARRTLQKGPAAGLGRRVTCRRILQAAARFGIESMEISAPLTE